MSAILTSKQSFFFDELSRKRFDRCIEVLLPQRKTSDFVWIISVQHHIQLSRAFDVREFSMKLILWGVEMLSAGQRINKARGIYSWFLFVCSSIVRGTKRFLDNANSPSASSSADI